MEKNTKFCENCKHSSHFNIDGVGICDKRYEELKRNDERISGTYIKVHMGWVRDCWEEDKSKSE